jgi:hypothetical protein
MHKYLLLLTLLPAVGFAQQPAVSPEGSDWHRVEALPLGVSIYVNARTRHQTCKLKTVDADTLTCSNGNNPMYQRAEITSIKITRRGRSALLGLGIGAGAGAITGFAVGTKPGGFFGPNAFRGAIAAVFAGIGGLAGAGVGAATDMMRSTIYKVP